MVGVVGKAPRDSGRPQATPAQQLSHVSINPDPISPTHPHVRRTGLAVVDDVHWLDAPSAEVLGFVARRLQAERIILLLAIRDSEPATLDTSSLPELRVHGLNAAAAETLLQQRAPTPVAAAVATRLAHTTAGNPLALLEIPALLSAEQLAGTIPLEEPLPAGNSLQRAFLRQVDNLPAWAQTALLVAAASDGDELSVITTAVGQLGIPTTALARVPQLGARYSPRIVGLTCRNA